MNQKTKKKTGSGEPSRYMVLVLGMHRSGTSALGGMLHHLGCSLPKTVMGAHKDNPKGYCESQAIRQFNDRLLGSARSSWRDWRPMNANWFASVESRAFAQEAEELFDQEFGKAALVMLKEPRLCRLVPFWREVAERAGVAIRPVLTHRNPMEIAKSVETRDGMLPAEGMLLWLRHVLEAEAATRGMQRYVTSYGALMQNWVAVANGAGKALDIVWPRFDERATQDIESFLSRDLRHHEELPEKITGNPTISDWIRESYRIFEDWTRDGERSDDYETLDRIRAEFDAAAPAFGPLLGATTSLPKLRGELEEARKRMAGLGEKLQEHEARGEELGKARETLQAELVAERQRTRVLEGRVKDRDERLVALDARGAELDGAREDLGAARRKLADLEARAQEAAAREAELGKAREAVQGELAAERRRAEMLEGVMKEKDARILELDARGTAVEKQREALEASLKTARHKEMTLESRMKDIQSEQQEKSAELKAALDDANNELSQARSALAQRRLEADQALERAEAAEKALADARGEAGELLDRKAEAETVVGDLAQRIEALELTEQTSRRELGEMARIICEQSEARERLMAETEERRAQVERQASELAEVTRKLQEVTGARETLERETRTRIAKLTEELASKTAQRERLDREAQDRQRELGRLAQLVIESEQALEARSAELAQAATDREALRAAQEARLAELAQGAERTRRQLEEIGVEQQARIEQLSREVAALRNSTSWRVTKPVRALVDLLRGNR